MNIDVKEYSWLRIDATLTGSYAIVLCNLFLGNVVEACSQAGLFELWYENAYEMIFGKTFEEPKDVVNTYDEVDGVCRAVAHLCEYVPVCNHYVVEFICYTSTLFMEH